MGDTSPPKGLTRGAGRPVPRRTRTFRPNYISFAGTYQCNLSCPHCCVPIEWPDRLDIPTALRFLQEARPLGVEYLGFTGGEPFLYPEFLIAITQRAKTLDFRFDKLMTNGLWFANSRQLRQTLIALRDAGFSGKIGLSVDKFHGMDISRLAQFCRTVRNVFRTDTILSLSYASNAPDQGLEPIRRLANELGGVVAWSDMLHRYLLVSDDLTMTLNWNHLALVERADRLPGNPWDGTWFDEDYCEGPGQALVINPRGDVKPCCGFASDLDHLTIGNIYTDSAEQVIRQGRQHPIVGRIFRHGLSSLREEILARDPQALPGATNNHCYFCWYVLTQELIPPPPGVSHACAASPKASPGRVSLPLASHPPRPCSSSSGRFIPSDFWLSFDGRRVHLHPADAPPPPSASPRAYRVRVHGPSPVTLPSQPLGWAEYQAWVDQMRAKSYEFFTLHDLHPASDTSVATP